MIIRREFLKKVLIGSILALQLTVTNALAVGPGTDQTSVEASISSNVEVDKETKEVEKVFSEDSTIDPEFEKAKRDEEFRQAENMMKAIESKKAEPCKKANEATKSKSSEIDEKAKEDREKNCNNLIDQYWKDIDCKEQEIKSIEKKFEKINLDLKSYKITKEEKQSLQEEINTLTELNEKLIIDISIMLDKVNKLISEKKQTNPKAEVDKGTFLCNMM